MTVEYEMQSIENSQGSGLPRPFVRLHQGRAMTADELAERLAESTTITAADMKAVMSELCHYAKEELSAGHRFYLPEIGYLSLSVGSVPPSQKASGKITGKDIYLRNIDFRPEARFLRDIRRNVSFEKSDRSSMSAQYAEGELWQKVEAYLNENQYVNNSIMRSAFGLSKYKAAQWLARFTADGRLVKRGWARQPLYFLP